MEPDCNLTTLIQDQHLIHLLIDMRAVTLRIDVTQIDPPKES